MTIVEFLLARIAEDEAEATRVPTSWLYPENYPALEMGEMGPGHTLIISPARVLAECQAKRAMVEESLRLYRNLWLFRQPPLRRVKREEYERLSGRHQAAAWALRHLAAVYAEHEDYREEWKP